LAGIKVEDVTIQSEVAPGCPSTTATASDPVGRFAVVCIAIAASVGVLPWLGESMFADEGATLYSAHLSWTNLWAQSQHVDLVLLPYYVLVHFWVLLSGNIVWIRALSLFAFFGTIVVIGWAGLRLAGRWCGIIASLLTATSTILVEKSLNARPYELSSFAVVLCAVFLFRWLEDSRARWLWAFSLLALIATAMQLFSLLAPASMLFGVLAVRPELIAQRLRVLLGPLVLLGVLSCAWIVACIGEVGQVNWIANETTETRLLAEIRGPVVGQFYDFLLIVIGVAALTKVAVVWNGGGRAAVIERVRQDRDALALTFCWAVIPTLILSIVSFAHPIYSVRYVAASAPGAALLAAFVCVRVFPNVLDPTRKKDGARIRSAHLRVAAILGAAAVVLLVIGYLGSASALQEDLKGPTRYAVQYWEPGDVIALPDHALTSVVQYYMASDNRQIPLWPQLGVRQRFVEGFDLSLHPSGRLPRRVWLILDGSVPGVTHFEKTLAKEGYDAVGYKTFDTAALVLYESTVPVTSVLSPSNGTTVSGTNVELIAKASAPNSSIKEVRFVLSGGGLSPRFVGNEFFARYSYWDSTTVPNGTYSLRSLATSASGKGSLSRAITITVDN
jgi:4-amino-4-deoxy-L-arabinose transferase-like glycosyltransferase